MGRPWFKPKAYGYGASPASWQGWAATLALAPLLIADIRLVPALFDDRRLGQGVSGVGAVVLMAGFLALVVLKGGGRWRWRWGGDRDGA